MNFEELINNIKSLEAAGALTKEQAEEAIKKIEAKKKEADEQAAKEKAEAEEKERLAKEEADKKYSEIKKDLESLDFDDLFDKYVPEAGKADNMAAELLSALGKIRYRWFNDGDRYFEGYGKETCGPAATFILRLSENEDIDYDIQNHLISTAEENKNDDDYERALEQLTEMIVNSLGSDEFIELFEKPCTKGYREYDESVWDDYEPKYELDCSIPNELQDHLDKGDISERDLEYEIQSWAENAGSYDAEVSISWGNVYIEDLNRDSYEELEPNLFRWLEQYADDLDNEFGKTDFECDDVELDDIRAELAKLGFGASEDVLEDAASIMNDFFDKDEDLFEREVLDNCKKRTSEEAASAMVEYFKGCDVDDLVNNFSHDEAMTIAIAFGLEKELADLGESLKLKESDKLEDLVRDICKFLGYKYDTEDNTDAYYVRDSLRNLNDLQDLCKDIQKASTSATGEDSDALLNAIEDYTGHIFYDEDRLDSILHEIGTPSVVDGFLEFPRIGKIPSDRMADAERDLIASELNMTEEEAENLMCKELGFDPNDFSDAHFDFDNPAVDLTEAKSHDYELLVNNGEAAASRGLHRGGFFEIKDKAKDLNHLLKKHWDAFFNDDFDDYFDIDPQDEEPAEIPEDLLEYIDGLDVTGGDPFIVGIKEDGKMIRDPKDDESIANGDIEGNYFVDTYGDAMTLDVADDWLNLGLKKDIVLDELYMFREDPKDLRYIPVSENASKYCRDIIGQLSDGYWENSNMERYWKFVSTDPKHIIVSKKSYEYNYNWKKGWNNAFYYMDDKKVKEYFANKIKFIAKAELESDGKDPIAGWKRDNDYELSWLHGTVGEAYRAYDELKGRRQDNKEYVDSDKDLSEDLDDFMWDKFFNRVNIDSFEYDDLDADVDYEWVEYTNTSGPMRDYGDTGEIDHEESGVVNRWTFWHDIDENDVALYLNKKVEEITEQDLEDIDAEDLYDFLKEEYREEAIEDAKENFDVDDLDENLDITDKKLTEETHYEGFSEKAAKDLAEELAQHLYKDHSMFYEIYPVNDEIMGSGKWFIEAEIDGDWKHDHLLFNKIAEEFFKNKGMIISIKELDDGTESSDDSYSSIHRIELVKNLDTDLSESK